ncbi:hypothetical protein ScPMuIL_000054 [Solemya velum]
MSASELSKEALKEFILAKGGRVTNHELVTNFKSYLNDPKHKALNRERFKEYVNSLASIKVDEKGEKVLVLKKRHYSKDSHLPTSLSSSDLQHSSERAQSEPPTNVDSVDGAAMSRGKSEGNLDNVSMASISSSQSIGGSLDLSTSSIASTSAEVEEEAINASVFSVKERAKHLNKIQSETELQRAAHPSRKKDSRLTRDADGDDDSHSSGSGYVTLDAEEKEWLVISASADYHPINGMLLRNPALVKFKTALHWAAKHGKPEVVKLIAGKPGINVNQRSGYTPLHIAAMQGHEDLIELLVQVYKADSNIRDYSGKKAKQYLRSDASTRAQQLLLSRKLGSNLTKSMDDSFMRTSSFRKSNRARAISSLIQASPSVMRQSMFRTDWGSAEHIGEERLEPPNSAPPQSCNTFSQDGSKTGVFEKNSQLMPPPTAPIRKSRKGANSSSKESLDGNSRGSVPRSESEPVLADHSQSKHTYI